MKTFSKKACEWVEVDFENEYLLAVNFHAKDE